MELNALGFVTFKGGGMLSSIKPFRKTNILTSLQIPIINYKQIQIMIFDFLFGEAHTKKRKKMKRKNTSEKKKIKKKKKT